MLPLLWLVFSPPSASSLNGQILHLVWCSLRALMTLKSPKVKNIPRKSCWFKNHAKVNTYFAARIISGKGKFNHITPVLRDLRWLTVTQQLYLRDAVFTFKCMTGCAPDYLRSKLVTRGQASGRVRRNSQQLNIPLFRTATGQRSFQYRAVSLWNSLDKDLKLSKNHEVFKPKLKHILRDT